MISIVRRIADDVADARKPVDQAARLRAVGPLAGGDDRPDWQAERVDRRMNFGSQTAFGPANTGSLKPPF